MKKEKDQVALYNLVFTHNWEDPEADLAALKIKSNDAVLAITSGGKPCGGGVSVMDRSSRSSG